MNPKVDIKENEILKQYPKILETILQDHTTNKNIFWATDNYENLGNGYKYDEEILSHLITGKNGNVIMPRVEKNKLLQKSRSKKMAEIFTPSWVCNAQINLVDNAWFDRQYVFNTEVQLEDGTFTWKTNKNKIKFPKNKTWKDYIRNTCLEITCGEAPYVTSRYDTVSGEFIPLDNRIGMLDRKLRIVNENIDIPGKWLENVQLAYKNTYAYEWQGDNLLLAREAMIVTFIENYKHKFGKEPLLKSIQAIANIISWNVWQMDGLKCIVPNSCKNTKETINNLFETKNETILCDGCKKNNMHNHNGIYCLIQDWAKKTKNKRKIKFINLFEGNIK